MADDYDDDEEKAELDEESEDEEEEGEKFEEDYEDDEEGEKVASKDVQTKLTDTDESDEGLEEAENKADLDEKFEKDEDAKEEFVEPETEFNPEISLDNVVPAVRTAEKTATSKEIIRKFAKIEIGEINQYITTNVPYSVLTQLFTLIEKPYEKAKVFTAVYRLVTSAMRYVSSEDTRKKLQTLLKDTDQIYTDLYPVLARFDNTTVNFNKHRLSRKIENFFIDQKSNQKVNKLIDAFLVFAEKQELMDIDKIAGLDLETPEGQKAHRAITTSAEVTPEE